MLTFISGDLFREPADIRINTVNCVGVMGKGVALQFKERFPEMFEAYRVACEAGDVQPGKLHIWHAPTGETVVNFPTKRHWREKSRYEDIDLGLESLRQFLESKGKARVALPALGCGHGGLDWKKVSKRIKEVLGDLEAEIIVFEPSSSRAVNGLERDPKWPDVAARLSDAGVRIADPADRDVPAGIRELFVDRVFIAGDVTALHRPIVGFVCSECPSQQELAAAFECAVELCAAGCTIGVTAGSETSLDFIRQLNLSSCYVSVVPSGGLLTAKNQDLLATFKNERIAFVSIEHPSKDASSGLSRRAAETMCAVSQSVLVASKPPAKTSVPLATLRQCDRPFFLIDYGDSQNATVSRLQAGRVARNRITGRPNIEPILQRVGIESSSTSHVLGSVEQVEKKDIEVVDSASADRNYSYPKRLIEVDLPIARISAHARREKSIRHGHISTLHIWWARRPLAACRAIICAALWPDPGDPHCPPAFRIKSVELITKFAKRAYSDRINEESKQLQEAASPESLGRWEAIAEGTLALDPQQKSDWGILRFCLLDFIADFANWDNSTVPAYLETALALTQAGHEALGGEPGTRPLVVDPFAGGGSIPLEALRVGADAFASDLNPVPVLLNKVVLDYIPKYGSRLAEEVRKWGDLIRREAEKELRAFYPTDPDGSTPIAYLWARTIKCEGPGCRAEVPLMRTMWLAKKGNRNIALQMIRSPLESPIGFRIIVKTNDDSWVDQTNSSIRIPNPSFDGTVKRGSATCPCCGYTTPVAAVRKQLKTRRGGAHDARLLVVVSTRIEEQGRFYRLATASDLDAIQQVKVALAQAAQDSQSNGAKLSLVPDEEISPNELRRISVPLYGMERWGDLFTPQAFALATLARLIKNSCRDESDREFADAVRTCLSLNFGRVADLSNALCGWKLDVQCPTHLFARQAIGMVWDFCESVCLSESSGSWFVMVDRLSNVLLDLGSDWSIGSVDQTSATSQPLPDDSASAIITDPPYYDAVPYAYLSDFFYVWQRRMLSDTHPSLYKSREVPKEEEIVVDRPHQLSKSNKDVAFYERELQLAFSECRRVLRPDGIGTIVFASKTTSSWEAILKATVDAGWVITGSWPIDTEMETRVSAQGQARLASSVHLVCRPREDASGQARESLGEWRDVLSELPKRIHEWMPRLAAEGVVGADAIFACLGPALEIFSRYSRVEKASGETVLLREYLEHVWAAVSTEALSMIFRDADAAGLEPEARLTAMWLWTLGAGSGQPANGNGKKKQTTEDTEGTEDDDAGEEEGESTGKAPKVSGFTLEFDAARKIAQGLGIQLEKSESIVEVKGDKARLLPVSERTRHLFGVDARAESGRVRRNKATQKSFFEEMDEAEAAEAGWTDLKGPAPGSTVLDRLHQAMILFAAGRGELMKRFLTEEGVGKDVHFWELAQSLSALYPAGTDEKRWVDGVLARKKGLGL